LSVCPETNSDKAGSQAGSNGTSNGHATDAARQAQEEGLRAGAECLAAALDYLARGWASLCDCPPDHVGAGKPHCKSCDHPGKRPLPDGGTWKRWQEERPDEATVREWWRRHPNANVGIALGPVSGLIRVDVEGATGAARLTEVSGGDLPDTLEFSSGGDGRGLLYAIPPDVELRTTSQQGEGEHDELRFQAKGAQTVLPPSRHHSGRRYAWREGHGPGEIEAAPAPAWLVQLLSAKGRRRKTGSRPVGEGDGEKIREGGRNSTLASLAGTMRRPGMSHAAILAALRVENEERCEPPLDDAEVEKIARSISGYPPDPEASAPITGGGGKAEAKDIIHAHFRTLYDPVFRRGEKIYCNGGREITRADACFGPDSALLDKLAQAVDAQRDEHGVKRSALPKLFVAAGLLRMATFGQVYAGGTDGRPHDETRTEQRSFLDWARLWAKPGAWAQVRSFFLWVRRADGTPGGLQLALRVEFFGQGSPVRELARMKHRAFADLAELYGVGTRTDPRTGKDCRAGGERVVELSPAFVAGLLEGPPLTDGRRKEEPAHAGEKAPPASTSEYGPYAERV
jgi:hypothetical protein